MTTPNNEPTNPYTSGNSGSSQQYPSYQSPQYQGQNQQYNQQYGQQPGYGYPGYPMMNPEGAQLAQTSMIFGILSLFLLGLIFGPIAIVKANRAEREFNTSATVGKVTGWIGTILAGLVVVYFIFIFFVIGAIGASGGFDSQAF